MKMKSLLLIALMIVFSTLIGCEKESHENQGMKFIEESPVNTRFYEFRPPSYLNYSIWAAPMPGIWLCYVKAGDAVQAGQICGSIVTMMMGNEIYAPRSATVLNVVAEGGTLVEYGTPLLHVTP